MKGFSFNAESGGLEYTIFGINPLHLFFKKCILDIDSQIEIVRYNEKKRNVIVYPKYELVHFHTARKTFCTLSLEKGMSAEEVMEISGHSDYRSFKRYVKVTEKRKKVVMAKAWGEVSNLKIVG